MSLPGLEIYSSEYGRVKLKLVGIKAWGSMLLIRGVMIDRGDLGRRCVLLLGLLYILDLSFRFQFNFSSLHSSQALSLGPKASLHDGQVHQHIII